MTPREIYYNLRPKGSGNGQKVHRDWLPVLGLSHVPPVNWMDYAPPPTPEQLIRLKEIAHESGIRLVNESEPFVTVYTDGSGYGEGKLPCGYAAVLEYQGNVKEVSRGEPAGTNQHAELSAIILALENLSRPMQVRLFSDSQYCVNSCRDWMYNWQARGWRKSKSISSPLVKNHKLIQRIYELCQTHWVEFNWVKGHAGNELNERCDKLAGEARKLQQPPDFF